MLHGSLHRIKAQRTILVSTEGLFRPRLASTCIACSMLQQNFTHQSLKNLITRKRSGDLSKLFSKPTVSDYYVASFGKTSLSASCSIIKNLKKKTKRHWRITVECNFIFTTTVLLEKLKRKGKDYKIACKHFV